MDRNQIRILRYILIPAVLVIIGIGLYYVAVRPVADMMASDILCAAVKSEPSEYSGDADSAESSSQTSDNVDFTMPYAGLKYGEIVCDEAGLKAPMYYDDTEDILAKGAGHSMLSFLPGQGGTILVGGHDTTYFAPLENIKEGNVVTINTNYGTFTYTVNKIDIVEGTDYEISEDKEQLVLYTCYPFGQVSKDRDKKILYICDKASGPMIGGEADE